MLSFSLCSGSSGNSTYVGTSSACLLIDCGLNGRQLARALNAYDLDPGELDAILLTHEHVDHYSGVGVAMRRYDIPLYLTEKTYLAVKSSLGEIDEARVHLITAGQPFAVRDTEILPFSTPHDAADPVGFRVIDRSGDIGVCTDLGYFSRDVRTALRGCRIIFLEANYDVEMLETGPYPRFLKQRIAGRQGHLSNVDAGEAAAWLVRYGAEAISLSHLSENNNRPGRAMVTVREALLKYGIRAGRDCLIQTSPRYTCSPSFESEAPMIEHTRFQCEKASKQRGEQMSFLPREYTSSDCRSLQMGVEQDTDSICTEQKRFANDTPESSDVSSGCAESRVG
ncbi:MAG: MBL fold metallo-hydrolase [Clostridiaceae bacterium]|nr:MBL fold metallo-hydrolase [Clostridiaceae bacterium]